MLAGFALNYKKLVPVISDHMRILHKHVIRTCKKNYNSFLSKILSYNKNKYIKVKIMTKHKIQTIKESICAT